MADESLTLAKVRRSLSPKGELEATQQTVGFFESLLQASTDGVVITDAAQNIVLANEAFCAFFGRPCRDVVETSLVVWLEQFQDDAVLRWADLERCVHREGSCRDVEFWLETPDGMRYFSVNASLLERVAGEEGRVILSIWRDVTDRVRVEEAVRRHAVQLTALNAAATAVQQAAFNEEDVFHAVTDQLMSLGLRGGISTLNQARTHFTVPAGAFPAEVLVALEKLTGFHTVGYTFPVEQVDVYRQVVESGEAVFVPDGHQVIAQLIPEPARRFTAQVIEAIGGEQGVFAPLVVGGQVVGLLIVVSADLTEEDVPAVVAFANHVAVAMENARLYRQLRRRTEELAVLNEIARVLSASLDFDQVYPAFVAQLRRLFDVRRTSIALVDEDSGDFRVRALMTEAERTEFGQWTIVPREDTPLAWVVERGRPLMRRDLEKERRFPIDEKLLVEGVRADVGLPLRAGDRILGTLNLASRQVGAFSQEDLPLLGQMADLLAVTIANAQLFAEVRDARDAVLNMLEDVGEAMAREQERVQDLAAAREASDRLAAQLAAVNRLDRIISSSLDLGEIYRAFAQESQKIIPFDRLSVALVEGDQVRARALDGTSLRSVPDYELGEEIVFPLARSAKEAVMESGRPLIRRDLVAEESYSQDRQLIEAGLRSGVVVPLEAKGRVLGTLNVGHCQVGAYSERDLPILQALADQLAIAIDNARLFEETERRARQLALVGDIARRAVALLDPDALLWETARAIQNTFGYPDVLIFLVDHEGQQLIRRAWAGRYNRDRTAGLSKPIEGRGILDWVATHGETVLANDVSQEPRYVPFYSRTVSELCVPLKDDERVLGGINVESEQTHAFDQSDVLAMETLADNLVTALRNAGLYQETQQRLAEISALFEVSGALRGAETVAAMLPIILEETIGVLDADTGAVFLTDETTGEFVAGAAHGRLKALQGLRLGPTEGVCGYVVQTRAPYPFIDPSAGSGQALAQDPHTGPRMQPLVEGVQGGICVPLLAGETVVGTLIVGSEEPRTFGDAEVRLLTAIADMAASAVHRTSLLEKLEHRVHELEALFEMGRAVTATLRVEDVLDLVVQVALRTLHAEGCYLSLWDEREKRLVLRAVKGFYQDHVGRMKYRLGEGLAGWVFLEEKPANVPDVAADPRWKRDPEHEATLPSGQVNSALVVPLSVRGKTLGVLGVVNKENGRRRMEDGRGRMEDGAPSSIFHSPFSIFTTLDESLLTALAGHVTVAVENARLYEDVRDLSLGAIRALATAIDARDPYTHGHSAGVTNLAVRLAREMGWRGADLEMLEFAALLHDVGKIAIPDAILRKTERLTLEDWDVIKLHPYHSAQMVKPVKALQSIVPWVYHHQERWDGTGYPDGLKGEQIPLASRIIAVADAYSAMTTDRPYRPARSPEEAVGELRDCAGTHFDPQVVEVFLRMLEEQSS